jgi:hypothetical protein
MIDELNALFVNTDPQGPILKPNKKTWEDKVNFLPDVQASFGFFAVATVSAPSLLQIPEVPLICEGIII